MARGGFVSAERYFRADTRVCPYPCRLHCAEPTQPPRQIEPPIEPAGQSA